MNIHNKHLSAILRIFTGLVFIASAILKYTSIDIFDLYIYEHNIFSISITETLTRLLIAAELVLGILFIFNIYAKFVYYSILSFLVGFTLYLFLLPYLFDVDITNCHCFGEAFVLSRIESIIKNVFILTCLVFVSPKFYVHKKWEKWITIVVSAATIIVLMLINAPNYLYTMVHKDKIQIDVPMYEIALANSGKEKEFTNGKQLICMYSASCEFCKRSAQKLHLILKNNNVSEDRVKAIFWSGFSDSTIYHFFYDKNISIPEYTTFRVDTFLNITNGYMPIILFSDNGEIIHKANYITLKDKDVIDFFQK